MWSPSKLGLRSGRPRNKACAVARTARSFGYGNGFVCYVRGLVNHLAHGETAPRAKIEHSAFFPIFEPVQALYMRVHQIHHMHIVPDTCAIGCIIIRAMDR